MVDNDDYDDDDDPVYRRGSLSDFSDYESSDEEVHNRTAASTSTAKHQYPHSRQYGSHSSDDEVDVRKNTHQALLDEEDPFADPFVDQ